MDKNKILIVDDDKAIVDSMGKCLRYEGFEVYEAYNGQEALDFLIGRDIHLIIMDVMMPKLDGISALMKIREQNNIPVIILSAKTEECDKILGLSSGADDYVTKPYNPAELVARIKALLRRYFSLGSRDDNNPDIITSGGLSCNMLTKEVVLDGEIIKVTATEYKIIEFLLKNKGCVFSAEQIYCKVWGEEAQGLDSTVMVHIKRIRDKLEINPKNPKYLKVVWGIGYKIEKY